MSDRYLLALLALLALPALPALVADYVTCIT
jgi:hypothetical protein